MSSIINIITEWPTIVYSVLLCVALLYWLMGIIGLVDVNHHGIHLLGHGHIGDIGHAGHVAHVGHLGHVGHAGHVDHLGTHGDIHAEGQQISTIASYATAFGLTSVPISLVLTLLVLFAWTATALAVHYLLPLVPGGMIRILAGVAVLVLALIPGIFFTALLSRPLRGLFVSHTAASNESLVGQHCRVLTLEVTESFGQGEVANCGASYKIMISASVPNKLGKGTMAHIVAYDAATRRFLVELDEEG